MSQKIIWFHERYFVFFPKEYRPNLHNKTCCVIVFSPYAALWLDTGLHAELSAKPKQWLSIKKGMKCWRACSCRKIIEDTVVSCCPTQSRVPNTTLQLMIFLYCPLCVLILYIYKNVHVYTIFYWKKKKKMS